VTESVRVAVVGLGWAGREIWLSRLAEHPAYEVVAVADRSAAARRSAAAAWPGIRVLADAAEVTPDLADLAVVAVPNYLHTPVAVGLLRRGVPVFLEKPVCLSSAEAAGLDAAERSAGGMLLAGSAARYRADVAALAAAVAREAGVIRHVELAWVRARGVPDAGGWFTRADLSGGGALVDLGWHLLDTISPILGPVDYEHVLGTVSDDFVNVAEHGASWRHDEDGPALSPGAGNVEDTARGFLVTSSGGSVLLRASWASHEAYDTTIIRVEGSAATISLRCTFGFSPNRAGGSELLLRRAGVCTPIPFEAEPVGSEYDRQLDALPRLLADAGNRGRAVAEARRTIGVIERFYGSAERAGSVPPRAAATV
jgi:oxidoreductase